MPKIDRSTPAEIVADKILDEVLVELTKLAGPFFSKERLVVYEAGKKGFAIVHKILVDNINEARWERDADWTPHE